MQFTPLNSTEEQLIRSNSNANDTTDLLSLVGNNKLYQKIAFGYFLVAQFFILVIFSGIPFLFYMPKFVCINSDGSTTYCTEYQACKSKNFTIESERISFITQFELYCERGYVQTMVKTLTFLIGSAGSFALSIASDYIGRKPLFMIATSLLIFGCLLGLQNNLVMAMLGIGMAILAQYIYFTFSYLYINEVVGADYRSRFIPVIQLTGVLGASFSCLISLWITSYSYIFILNIVVHGCLSLLVFYFVETPFILNKRTNKDSLFNALCFINKVNYKGNPCKRNENIKLLRELIWKKNDPPVVNTRTIADSSDTHGKTEIHASNTENDSQSSKARGLYIKVCFLFLNVYIVLGLSVVASQWIGNGNVQINTTLFSISQMVGFLYSSKYAHEIKRKALMIKFSIITILIPSLLFISGRLEYFGKSYKTGIDLALVLVLFAASGPAISIICTYASELFPTKTRGLGIGCGLFVGRASFIISDLFTNMGIRYNLNPICFCIFQGIIALFCAISLEETLNRKLKG